MEMEMGCLVPNLHTSTHIYEDVFNAWLHSDQYRHWKRDDVTWQLRCVGGPGSGKVCRNLSTYPYELSTDMARLRSLHR